MCWTPLKCDYKIVSSQEDEQQMDTSCCCCCCSCCWGRDGGDFWFLGRCWWMLCFNLHRLYTWAAPGVQINDCCLAEFFLFGVPLVEHRCDAVGYSGYPEEADKEITGRRIPTVLVLGHPLNRLGIDFLIVVLCLDFRHQKGPCFFHLETLAGFVF